MLAYHSDFWFIDRLWVLLHLLAVAAPILLILGSRNSFRFSLRSLSIFAAMFSAVCILNYSAWRALLQVQNPSLHRTVLVQTLKSSLFTVPIVFTVTFLAARRYSEFHPRRDDERLPDELPPAVRDLLDAEHVAPNDEGEGR